MDRCADDADPSSQGVDIRLFILLPLARHYSMFRTEGAGDGAGPRALGPRG